MVDGFRHALDGEGHIIHRGELAARELDDNTTARLAGRDILIVTDESTANESQEIQKHIRVVDISDERNPKEIARMPIPGNAEAA